MRVPVGSVLLLLLVGVLPLRADVIYLKNGNVIITEKAWEEGNQVKYQVNSGIVAIPRVAVKRIQEQKANPPDPSHQQSLEVEVIRGTGAPETPSAGVKSTPESATTTISSNGRSLRFQDSAGFEEALRLQKATGKPIALYFYVDWCPYCVRLERSILSRSEVKQFLENMLYVTVNPEHGKADQSLFASFGGRGFPTFLIVTKDRSAHFVPTSVPPDSFVQACKVASQAAGQ